MTQRQGELAERERAQHADITRLAGEQEQRCLAWEAEVEEQQEALARMRATAEAEQRRCAERRACPGTLRKHMPLGTAYCCSSLCFLWLFVAGVTV